MTPRNQRVLRALALATAVACTGCARGCTSSRPPIHLNPSMDRQPKVLTQVILVREWLIELLWLGLVYSMFRRWRAASPLRRPAIGPAFVAGTLLGVFQWAHITTRQLGAPADLVIALSSVWTLCIVAVCAAFLFGLVWRRMLLARTLGAVGAALRVSDDRVHMRHALRTALGDATTDLLFRERGVDGWRDARGQPIQEPQAPASDHAGLCLLPARLLPVRCHLHPRLMKNVRRRNHSAPLEPSGNFVVPLLYQGERGRPTRAAARRRRRKA